MWPSIKPVSVTQAAMPLHCGPPLSSIDIAMVCHGSYFLLVEVAVVFLPVFDLFFLQCDCTCVTLVSADPFLPSVLRVSDS